MKATVAVAADRRAAGGLFDRFAWLFHKALDRIDAGLSEGAIEATLPDGYRRRLGGRKAGPTAIVDIASWRALVRLANGGSAGWYVAWREGEWSSPDPVALFDLFMRNRYSLGEAGRARGIGRLIRQAINAGTRNSRAGARRNVAAHYDLGNDFYAAWLDPTLSYSSAMFVDPGEPLEVAQRRKLAAMLARTGTNPGDRILEIGCGWGSFAAFAAEAGRQVHAITLSTEQKRAVEARLKAADIRSVEVSLIDYRDVTGTYDAVVSIEMVEAVGQAYWPEYLGAIARALRPGGRAAVQFIAIDDAIFESYARNVDFIQRHVFPGGMLLSESRFRALADAAGLDWVDRVGFAGDYAETLRRWRLAFDVAVAQGRLGQNFERRFIDLWRYYLMYCEGGFSGGGIDVAQVTLVRR